MDPATMTMLQQLGLAGAIVFTVIYLQRAQTSNLKHLLELVLPALDVRSDVSRLEGKVDALHSRMDAELGERRGVAAE